MIRLFEIWYKELYCLLNLKMYSTLFVTLNFCHYQDNLKNTWKTLQTLNFCLKMIYFWKFMKIHINLFFLAVESQGKATVTWIKPAATVPFHCSPIKPIMKKKFESWHQEKLVESHRKCWKIVINYMFKFFVHILQML